MSSVRYERFVFKGPHARAVETQGKACVHSDLFSFREFVDIPGFSVGETNNSRFPAQTLHTLNPNLNIPQYVR